MSERPEISQLSPAMRALSDLTRLKILLMLEGQPRSVGEIVSFFNLSQPTITRHLQTLSSAGLVNRRRQGQQVVYELNPEALRSFCFGLVSSFSCCCGPVAVQLLEVGEKKTDKKSEHAHRQAKTTSKRKGE